MNTNRLLELAGVINEGSAGKIQRIWMQISDAMTDLEDELLDRRDDPRAQEAIQYLRDGDYFNLHTTIRKIFDKAPR